MFVGVKCEVSGIVSTEFILTFNIFGLPMFTSRILQRALSMEWMCGKNSRRLDTFLCGGL